MKLHQLLDLLLVVDENQKMQLPLDYRFEYPDFEQCKDNIWKKEMISITVNRAFNSQKKGYIRFQLMREQLMREQVTGALNFYDKF